MTVELDELLMDSHAPTPMDELLDPVESAQDQPLETPAQEQPTEPTPDSTPEPDIPASETPAAEPAVAPEAVETPDVDPIEALRLQVLELTAKLNGQGVTAPAPQPEAEVTPTLPAGITPEILAKAQELIASSTPPMAPAQPQAPANVQDRIDFIRGRDLSAILSPEGLNEVLNEMFQITRQVGMRDTTEVARAEAGRALVMQKLSEEFYRENTDLRGKEPMVQYVCNELIASNPAITASDLLKRAGDETRKRLGLGSRQAPPAPTKRQPGFVSTGGARLPSGTPAPAASVADELLEMKKLY